MQNTSARPLWPLHALAIPLIAVLGWLIYDEKSRDFTPEDTESLAKTLRSSQEMLSKSNRATLSQMERTAYGYRDPHNEEWIGRAKRVAALAEKARKEAFDFFVAKQTPHAVHWTPKTVIQPDIKILADSLLVLAGGDSLISTQVRTALFDENRTDPPAWWNDVLRQNKKEAMELWCSNLSSQITLAEERALQHIAPNICEPDDLNFDHFEIALAPAKSRIRPGEPFEAEAYLVPYSTHTQNVRVFANGKPLPIENGKALFNHTYQTPGRKSVDVRIEIHNPVTGQVETVQKEFGVEVLAKCESKQ